MGKDQAEERNVPSYLGQWVFVEKEKGDSSYNGEYFVVQQTPCTLYGAKLIGGYGGNDLKKFSLVGADKWQVVSSYEDDEAAVIGIASMKHFAGARLRGEKLAWCDSVYSDCANNARMAERAIQIRRGTGCQAATPAPKTVVATIDVFSDGTLKVQPA